LFVDFVRPLPSELVGLNAKVIEAYGESEFVMSAVRNWRAWEQQHGASLDRTMLRLHRDRESIK